MKRVTICAVLGWAVVCLHSGSASAQVALDGRVALDGAPNFRGIGGYQTTDGRRIRAGLVYRSGHLGDLTDADYQQLARLNVSAVCDFRADEERTTKPARWRGSAAPEFIAVPSAGGGANAQFFQRLVKMPDTQMRGMLTGIYQRAVAGNAPIYALTLDHLVDARGAVIYHCSAGKDRTGVFTALLLTFLGVPRETIVEDFLLSNRYTATPQQVQAMAAKLETTAAAAESLIGVRREYLDAAFAAIDKQYGTLDDYRRSVLEFPDADVERLRARLLQR